MITERMQQLAGIRLNESVNATIKKFTDIARKNGFKTTVKLKRVNNRMGYTDVTFLKSFVREDDEFEDKWWVNILSYNDNPDELFVDYSDLKETMIKMAHSNKVGKNTEPISRWLVQSRWDKFTKR
jgi:hypothetical protein